MSLILVTSDLNSSLEITPKILNAPKNQRTDLEMRVSPLFKASSKDEMI